MEYIRITSIHDPLFVKMHELMKEVFPPEEVLEFELWKEPLEDSGIRVFAAVHEGDVVGATEYRYYPQWNIAMTDFTIIGRQGLSIGRFLAQNRSRIWMNLPAKTVRSYLACLQKFMILMGLKTMNLAVPSQ